MKATRLAVIVLCGLAVAGLFSIAWTPDAGSAERSVGFMGRHMPPGHDDDDDDSSIPYLLDPVALRKLGLAPKTQTLTIIDLSKFLRPQPIYKVRIHAIRTADTYQTQAAIITPAQIKLLVDQANMVYWSAGIEFLFDPVKDFEHRNSTLLNQDCSLANFGQHISDPNWDPKTVDTSQNAAERTKIAKQYPGKAVVFFRWGTKFTWDDSIKNWKVGPASGGFSSHAAEYVAMTRSMPEKNLLAHELGHYLHAAHTHVGGIDTVAKAAQAIKDWVEKKGHPTSEGLIRFDGDNKALNPDIIYDVKDTPPDVGGSIFISAYGKDANCGPTDIVQIGVKFSGGYQAYYTLAPDRRNIMSYFKHCHNLGLFHLSKGQIANARAALQTGNRHHLVK